MTPLTNRLTLALSIGFILAAVLTTWLIVDAHAEDRATITQITQDLPKVASISEELFGQDSLVRTHGVEVSTRYSFCDEKGKNCSPTWIVGARG